MVRPITQFIFLLLTTVSLQAQPPGFRRIADDAGFRQRFETASRQVQTIKSDFIQEKNLAMLSETIRSKGIFLFKRDNRVRMEYTRPFRYLLIINQDKVLIRDEQKSNTFSAKSNKLFETINKIIIDCVQGTAMDNKDFGVSAWENDKQYVLMLVPVRKTLKTFFSAIHIYIDKKDYSVNKMDMIEPSGDHTLIVFTNKQFNVLIPDAEFSVGR